MVPFFGDQPFWADRVHELSIGPPSIPQAELTVGRLAFAIERAVVDKEMAAHARGVGQQMSLEDGVRTAAAVVETFIAQQPTFDWRAP